MLFPSPTALLVLALSAAPAYAEKLPPSLRNYRIGLAGSKGRGVSAVEKAEALRLAFGKRDHEKRQEVDVGGPRTVSSTTAAAVNRTVTTGTTRSTSTASAVNGTTSTSQRTPTLPSYQDSAIASIISSIESVRESARSSMSAERESSADATASPSSTQSPSSNTTTPLDTTFATLAAPASSSSIVAPTASSSVDSSSSASNATATTAPFVSIAGIVSALQSTMDNSTVVMSTESGTVTVVLSTSFVNTPRPTADASTSTDSSNTTTASNSTAAATPAGIVPLLNTTGIISPLLNATAPVLGPVPLLNQTVDLPPAWTSAFGNISFPSPTRVSPPVATPTLSENATVVAVPTTTTLANGTTVESIPTSLVNGTTLEPTTTAANRTTGETAPTTTIIATNVTLATPAPSVNQTRVAGSFSATTTASFVATTTASTDSADAWIPTSTLFVNTPESTYSAKPTPVVAGAKTTTVDGAPQITITSQYPFPTNLPSKIVPAAAAAAMGQQPKDSTLVSLLFDSSLSWTWMVQNSNASGQVLFYTPLVIMAALGLTNASDVQTVALEAFQPVTFDGDASKLLTVYLAYVPSSSASDLQAMVSAPTSQFYQQSGIQSQIAAAVVPSFSVFSYASTALAPGSSDSSALTASDMSSTSAADAGKQRSNTIIIAVVVTFGVVMLVLAGYAAFRQTKRGAILLSSRQPEQRTQDPQHRAFQLGQGGRMQLRDSTSPSIASSSSSRSSVASDPFSSHDATVGSTGHATSSSVDHGSDRRGSWWRFSGGSATGHGSNSPSSGGMGEMREQNHRRINVLRGPDGQVASSNIGRPHIQSNSLML